jgi:transposase
VERARIVLMAAPGLQNRGIAAHLRITPEKVARWRRRFLAGGVAALEHDAPRPGRPRTITAAHVERVIRKTTQETPPQPTHWSARSIAAASGHS